MATAIQDLPDEIWKPVVGWEGLYEVSDLGRVRSIKRMDCAGRHRKGKFLQPSKICRNRYPAVSLNKNGIKKTRRISHLVLEAFIGPRTPDKPMALHWDDDASNNIPSNLRWGTQQDNEGDAQRNNRKARGSRMGNAILTEDRVRNARVRVANGETCKDIAKEFGIHPSALNRAVRGEHWRHVTPFGVTPCPQKPAS